MKFRNIVSAIVVFSYLSAYVFIVADKVKYALITILVAMSAIYAYVIHLDIKEEIEKEAGVH